MPKECVVIPTVQLYLGFHEQAVQKACSFIQSIFCVKDGCTTCITCVQINEKRHASCLWLSPKKQYVLDDLLPLQEKLQFSLGEQEHFFLL